MIAFRIQECVEIGATQFLFGIDTEPVTPKLSEALCFLPLLFAELFRLLRHLFPAALDCPLDRQAGCSGRKWSTPFQHVDDRVDFDPNLRCVNVRLNGLLVRLS